MNFCHSLFFKNGTVTGKPDAEVVTKHFPAYGCIVIGFFGKPREVSSFA